MKKRNYTKKQMAAIIILSIAMLALAAMLNQFFPARSREVSTEPERTEAPQPSVAPGSSAEPEPSATPTPDPTEKIATFLQGPRSWEKRLEWSGRWGEEFYDGGKFGSFGCGLCCMANLYTTFSGHQCSPYDMYQFAKEETAYGGGGAIDWGYIRAALEKTGFTSAVGRKPAEYDEFQKQVMASMACIVLVSSNNSDCYWKNTSGHYVTIFPYDKRSDKVFLADSGDPDHNRSRVELKKIYKSLKTSNNWQYLAVTAFDKSRDTWKHKGFGDGCVLPEGW